MTITRIWIEEGCITCGNSESVCPEVFKIDIPKGTAAVIEDADYEALDAKIRQAAASCPVRVIKFESA